MYINTVQQYKADVAFKTLVEGMNDNLYFIPKYQRKFRWNKKQVQDLARSLIKGYPIPPIYAYRNNKGQLEILDGQQRIMSLYFYYIGKYIDTHKVSALDYRKLDITDKKYYDVLAENYDLVDMVTYLDEKAEEKQDISYQSLSADLKRRVDYITITVIELRWENMEERALDLQRIFNNLNLQGTILSSQELRNGIYDCPFYDMLKELNSENEDWKKIIGRESDTEEDMECLLRLCTVWKNVRYEQEKFVIENYHRAYSDWMDKFSENAMKMEKEIIQSYKVILEKFFSRFLLNKVLGLQKALLESLFVVTEIAALDVTITNQIVDVILQDSHYTDNSRQGTVKTKQMNERWRGVYAVLSKYIE